VNGVIYEAGVNGTTGLMGFVNTHPELSTMLEMDYIESTNRYRLINKSTWNSQRIRLIWYDTQGYSHGGIGSYDGKFDNPTAAYDKWNNVDTDIFCLAPAPIPQVTLTIDEKGLQPADSIYSGTISPPKPNGLSLSFGIQGYKLDNSQNWRVAQISSDSGIYLNREGTRWFVDLNNLGSYAQKPGPNSMKSDGRYVISINAVLTASGEAHQTHMINNSWSLKYITADGVEHFENTGTVIPATTLRGNMDIRHAIISDNVEVLEEGVLDACQFLETVVIGKSVKHIGNSVLKGSRRLQEIKLPDGLLTIGAGAFSGSQLGTTEPVPDTLTIPASVTNIGDYAFEACAWLTKYILHASIPPAIGECTFTSNYDRLVFASFYVPAESLEAYKTAPFWSGFADQIYVIP
jgi:hypothetical protein